MGYEKQFYEQPSDHLYDDGAEMEAENLRQEVNNLRIQLAAAEQSRDQFKRLAEEQGASKAELRQALERIVCGIPGIIDGSLAVVHQDEYGREAIEYVDPLAVIDCINGVAHAALDKCVP